MSTGLIALLDDVAASPRSPPRSTTSRPRPRRRGQGRGRGDRRCRRHAPLRGGLRRAQVPSSAGSAPARSRTSSCFSCRRRSRSACSRPGRSRRCSCWAAPTCATRGRRRFTRRSGRTRPRAREGRRRRPAGRRRPSRTRRSGRDQDRLHPLGRDHGHHAWPRSPTPRSGCRPRCWPRSASASPPWSTAAVALIVKADDAGVALAASDRPVSGLLGFGGAAPSAPPPAPTGCCGP